MINIIGRVKSRNMYKERMDKDKGWGRIECGRWGVGKAQENNGGEMGTIVIEQQLKNCKISTP